MQTDENRRPTANAAPRLPRIGEAWTALLLLTLLALLALLPRLALLGTHSLWLDEGGTWQAIQQPWAALLADLFNPTSAYPLYHLLLKSWVVLAGDSETALRLPSALAGVGAVGALAAAAGELQHSPTSPVHPIRPHLFPTPFGLTAALLLAVAPFATWYAHEAKVYSLLLLLATLLLWSFARAQRQETRGAWLLFGGLALTSLFVHRLALLLLLAAWVAWLLARPVLRRRANYAGGLLLLWLAARLPWLCVPAPGVPIAPHGRLTADGWRLAASWWGLGAASLATVAAMVLGLGSGIAQTGASIAAGPLLALRLTLLRFSLNRGPDEAPWWWLIPWLALALWGGALLLRDGWRGAGARRATARLLLCFLVVPTGIFLAQLAFTNLYQARYLLLVYPAWLLLLAYPALDLPGSRWSLRGLACCLLVGTALATSAAALVQPGRGMLSGAPVKEQYREAFALLAARLHPDDAVVLHPAYLQPLYAYYMPRLTADPPPPPITFAAFKHLQTRFNARDWDEVRRQRLAGHLRSFLVIAPAHARTVDRPLASGDEYGLVGLYYQYSREQKKWPCGIWRYNGVHVLCQSSPEAYETGTLPRPATQAAAHFGPTIRFEGYTLKATLPGEPGRYQAGGSLPITLFWDVARPPAHDSSIFLHLCQHCDLPPAASVDGPPLAGYLPTSTWLPGKPVHDERALPLPPDLAPGRYTLLLGLYPVGNPAPGARLPVQPAGEGQPTPVVHSNNRLVLGTVEIVRPVR